MFCPDCKSLMFPQKVDGKNLLFCKKCQKHLAFEKDECYVASKKRDKEMLVVESNAATLPKAKVECPKCLHNEAFWVLRQTRAADEPETKIYRCVKCQHSWREYG